MKQKYHFFTLTETGHGKSLLSLPGQTLGTQPIFPGILVKDGRGGTAVASAKRRAAVGDILFTSTLRRNGHGLVASDMHNLKDNTDVLLSDALDLYERLTSEKQ